jgi:hypothetical protein
MILYGEMKVMTKETVVAYLKMLNWYFTEMREGNHQDHQRGQPIFQNLDENGARVDEE